MSPGATFERVYLALKTRIREGYFRPGEHIDPSALGEDLASSVTPVRDALHRLVSERLVDAPRGEGFRAPLLTEVALRHAYSWNADLLLLALRSARFPPAPAPELLRPLPQSADPGEIAAASDTIFVEIVRSSANPEHAVALANVSDRLHAVRLIEPQILENVTQEISGLIHLFIQGNVPGLRRAIISYQKRRHRAAPYIVEALHRPVSPGSPAAPETI